MTKREGRVWLAKLLILTALLVCLVLLVSREAKLLSAGTEETAQTVMAENPLFAAEETEDVAAPEITPEPTAVPDPTPLPDFAPVRSRSDAITGTKISVNGVLVDSYAADAAHTMDFAGAEDYTDMKGIIAFRGNNFRNTSQYGLAEIDSRTFGEHWVQRSGGSTDSYGNYWGGSCWTGQPLVVEWPAQTKRIMNMYDWAKEKEGLVEVIYACLDGRVHFIDLETGMETRDSMYLGLAFKGAGALDPRGYPLLYVGAGLYSEYGQAPRIMIVSLIDGEILYTTGVDDELAPRASWSAFDSSPLVDAETDQLIYPGENGVIYIEKLNTRYDEAAGTISIDPEEIKFSFTSTTADEYYYGMEDSALAWRGYLFVADNGADFICLDLNTLEIVWRFDCLDDTNCTAVMEVDETGHPYLYLSTSYHLGWRGWDAVTIPVWKIDAVTGQEVWHHDYECYSVEGLSGGVEASLSLGKGPLEGIVYVAMARCPNLDNGMLLALDAATGEEVWINISERI